MKRPPTPKLSVLIPTITARETEANALFRDLEQRVIGKPVEILMLRDNRFHNLGEKRNQLLRAATGDYITFLDDDDVLLDDYFTLVLEATQSGADVITYDQWIVYDGMEGRVNCRLGYEPEAFAPGAVCKRPPWFWCAWKRDLATAYRVPQSFTDANGITHHEDLLWLRHLWLEATTEAHIPKVLHRYQFDSTKTTLQMALPFNADNFIAEEFLRLRDKHKLTTAIETGAYNGDTTLWLAKHFTKVASCELDQDKFERCQERFGKEEADVAFYQGSSDELLARIVADIKADDATIFFLDAHTSGFAGGYCPLLQELDAIAKAKLRPIIAIHDMKEPSGRLGWDTYNEQDYTLEWIAPALDRIYGAGDWTHYFNTPERAAGEMRGIIYIEPRL